MPRQAEHLASGDVVIGRHERVAHVPEPPTGDVADVDAMRSQGRGELGERSRPVP
jgi:hypothetical protein